MQNTHRLHRKVTICIVFNVREGVIVSSIGMCLLRIFVVVSEFICSLCCTEVVVINFSL